MKRLIPILVLLATSAFGQLLPYSGGVYTAADYGQWQAKVLSGPNTTGSVTYTMAVPTVVVKGRTICPFAVNAPLLIGTANQETATPSAVSNCIAVTGGTTQATVTVTVANAHGAGEIVQSGSFGLQEAINDAAGFNPSFGACPGGVVAVDAFWGVLGGTNTILTAAVPFSCVSIEDRRSGVQYWTPTQNVATVLAAPATLTATTVGFGLNGANTTGGAYNGASTYHYCVAYVDIMGNEGPCSADFSAATAGTGTTNQIGVAAPAASTGAVGYTVYISLAGGTYNLTYQAPLTNTTCVGGLTTLETVTPACKVTNATYGQTGGAAIISSLTVNTAPLHLLATTASTTAAYIGTPSGRTVYKYAPHGLSAAATSGWTTSQQAYAISVAPATTVPTVIATIPVPTGAMNFVGSTIEICLNAVNASGGTATIEQIQFWWDAAGSNTTGAGVLIGNEKITATQVSSPEQYSACETFQTTVSGSGVTAGSIMPVAGAFWFSEGAGTLHSAGPDVLGAATGSLNLAGTGGNTQRIHVVYLHTTGTDAAGTTTLGLTVKVL